MSMILNTPCTLSSIAQLLGGTFSRRSSSCTVRLLAQSTTKQASSQSMKAAAGLASGFFGRSFIRLQLSAQLRGRQAEERNFATAFLKRSPNFTLKETMTSYEI